MKMRIIALLLVLAMPASFTACGSAGSTAQADTQSFTDDAGRQVAIPAEISRIVPAGPLAQMILFAIAPDLLVGLASKWPANAQGIIDQKYLDLPYLGQLYGSADLNVEELALADPQLIIDIGQVKNSAKKDMDTLQQQTTIPTVFISSTLETMPQTYRTLGKLLGREERGEELAQFCEKVYARTASIMQQVGDKKINALYVLGQEGLNVLAKTSYQAELVDMLTNNLAVVDNPVSKGSGNAVSMEQIALWNPDFVIFGPDSIFRQAEQLASWREISAIANKNYVEVPDVPHNWMSMPPAVQRYLGLIWLTAELYPKYCDYDVKAEIMEYYRLFYGCALTEDQYAAITANAFLEN